MTWTLAALLRTTHEFFTKRGIETARLDAEVLLAYSLGVDRVYLYTHYDQPLTTSEVDAYRELVRRRAAREPVAYIVGNREFYGRDFAVNRHVLIPRPETEHVIEAVLPEKASRILDVGVGSGAIAVTLAAELPDAEVVAIDISAEAIEVASQNALKHGVKVTFLQGDLLEPAMSLPPFDVIVSNPPYVELDAELSADVRSYEPGLALFGGADGLDVLRRLCAQVPSVLKNGGVFACEIGAGQKDAVLALCGWGETTVINDLQGHPRVVMVRRTS